MTNRELKSKVVSLANRLTPKFDGDKSAAFCKAWAVIKAGKLELTVKGVTFGNRQEALKRLAAYAPDQVRQEKKSIFTEMKQSDIGVIDRKIHDLLIADGYRVTGIQKFEGMKLNNYTDVNRMEYRRGERERVFIYTNTPNVPKTNKIAGMLWEPVAPEALNGIEHIA